MDLKKISEEIKQIVSDYQKKNNLSFIEDTHTYFINGKDGKVTSDMPSVSTVLGAFYTPFDAESTRAFKNCGGDLNKEKELLSGWQATADYATSKGSRVHYLLETDTIAQYGAYKEVRKPIFECDKEQIYDGDQMIKAGKEFLDLMHSRGAVLLDTEMVLGNVEYGYFGQPDTVWLMKDGKGGFGIVITDWKSNKESNMSEERKFYTKQMLYPFEELMDNALNHYKVQLPLYGKLLVKMLEGSKYEDVKFLGAVIVHLTRDGKFKEHRISKGIIDTIFDMNVKKYL